MLVNTTRFGQIDLKKDRIIHFDTGLSGLDQFRRYFLVHYEDSISWLQSIDAPDIAFMTANPFNFFPSYSFTVNDETEKSLGLKEPLNIAVLVLLSLHDNIVTANLKAPIIINGSNKKASQVTINDAAFSPRMPLPENI